MTADEPETHWCFDGVGTPFEEAVTHHHLGSPGSASENEGVLNGTSQGTYLALH